MNLNTSWNLAVMIIPFKQISMESLSFFRNFLCSHCAAAYNILKVIKSYSELKQTNLLKH